MEPEMKHEGPHKHGKHGLDPKSYWASWCSPVGLGIFIVAVTIAAVIALHALLAIAVMASNMHDRDEMHREMRGTYPGGVTMPAPAMPEGPAGPAMMQ